jgi:hypothetical protein
MLQDGVLRTAVDVYVAAGAERRCRQPTPSQYSGLVGAAGLHLRHRCCRQPGSTHVPGVVVLAAAPARSSGRDTSVWHILETNPAPLPLPRRRSQRSTPAAHAVIVDLHVHARCTASGCRMQHASLIGGLSGSKDMVQAYAAARFRSPNLQ